MKALILNCQRTGDDILKTVSDVMIDELGKAGHRVHNIPLHDLNISSCRGCFGCWTRTPGICIIDDVGRDIARKMVQSDMLVCLTPIVFGGYSSQLQRVLERLIPNILPLFMKKDGEIHHKPRYDKYPALVSIGTLPNPDEETEALFKKLVNRNAINLNIPFHLASVVYSSEEPEKIRETARALIMKAGENR